MQERIFCSDVTFESIGLKPEILRGLHEKGFERPTGIQGMLIPPVLAGKDVLGQAKTGTGKTAAFGLPLINQVDPEGGLQAIILVPTRELALQVSRELRDFARHTHVRVTPIYGGERRHAQISRLLKNPAIIVGTPGRVMDLHQSGELPYDKVRFVVLDEVDRMLDIGFRDDIRRILSRIPTQRQTIFVSATISPEIESLARKFMRDPEKLVSTDGSLTVAQVDQTHFIVQRWDKRRLLLHLLTHEEPALTVVFCATKREVDRVTAFLTKHGIEAHSIHGDMYQRKRDQVMEKLRGGKLSVLIASDVASRGLDVSGISHVINYDIPVDPEVYVHRIGRTARLGRNGVAWTFVTPEEGELLTSIELLINREVPRKDYPDFIPGPIPAEVLAERERAEEVATRGAMHHSRHLPLPVTPEDAQDPTRFPGGVVPVSPPPRRLGGRMRLRRR
ncbi:MAG: DEAD/DEAH box helicase [Phycisphaeraceae bacterium]|nr:DEAD/DEAH box helicase [Phycisphaerales bacterium]QOJ18396.1 MAG: DEAD/DEAH box helicase [Phycisphaeraceae bacterium]